MPEKLSEKIIENFAQFPEKTEALFAKEAA